MPRNFERRYELMFPIAQPGPRRAVLQELRAQLRDDVNTFLLQPDGSEEAHWGGRDDCHQLGAPRSRPRAQLPESDPAPEGDELLRYSNGDGR